MISGISNAATSSSSSNPKSTELSAKGLQSGADTSLATSADEIETLDGAKSKGSSSAVPSTASDSRTGPRKDAPRETTAGGGSRGRPDEQVKRRTSFEASKRVSPPAVVASREATSVLMQASENDIRHVGKISDFVLYGNLKSTSQLGIQEEVKLNFSQ